MPIRWNIGVALVLVACAGMVGCAGLPTAGPTTDQVYDQEVEGGKKRFDIVEVDNRVVAALAAHSEKSFQSQFDKNGKPPDPTIGIGDTLTVSIWEAGGNGLFGTAPTTETIPGMAATSAGGSRAVTIPEQVVAPDGAISVPFAGRVPAAGLTPLQVQQTIEKRLADRAVEPQVIVTITKPMASTVTVNGEIVTGNRVPLSVRGDRLLDVIASAGGAKAPLYETDIRLSRGEKSMTIPMTELVANPAENIYVWPGDVLTLIRAPQTFSVFGATLNNLQIPFGADKVNLAQAIAKAGGLSDVRADPEGVFLFRFEAPEVAKALDAPPILGAPSGVTPILYHLNLRDPASYFLATRFPIEDDDIIYVANAQLAELEKFLTILGTIVDPVLGGVVLLHNP
jgi:polysaccharide biosynthesis/export protein